MNFDLGKTFDRTPEGYNALTWVLYLVSGAIALATLGEFSGTLLFIGSIAVIVLASSRKNDAAGTIHASHLENISSVMTVLLVAAICLMVVTFITFGFGVILTWPIYLLFLAWAAWRFIRGLIKLNDNQPLI